jgi:hypothetical protein
VQPQHAAAELDAAPEQLGVPGQRDARPWRARLALEPVGVARMGDDRGEVGEELPGRDRAPIGGAKVLEQAWGDVRDVSAGVPPERQDRTGERALVVVHVWDVARCHQAWSAAQFMGVLGYEEHLRGPGDRPQVGSGRVHQPVIGQDPLRSNERYPYRTTGGGGASAVVLARGGMRVARSP